MFFGEGFFLRVLVFFDDVVRFFEEIMSFFDEIKFLFLVKDVLFFLFKKKGIRNRILFMIGKRGVG